MYTISKLITMRSTCFEDTKSVL